MPDPEPTPSPTPTPAPDTGINPPAPLIGDPPAPEPIPTPEPTPEPKLGPDGKPLPPEPKLGPDGKPIEEKPEPRALEEYTEFTIPEGTTLDEQTATEFKGLAKELDLTQEQAQKLLDFGGGKLRAQIEAPYKLWAETQAKWQAEVKADPDIGGTKFEQSIKDAAQIFVPGESNPFVKDEAEAKSLRDALNMTGAGNNPAIVKLFVKMGTLLKEPGSLSGGPVKDTQDTLLAKMYPTMNETQTEGR
ncbi:conserved hypothetical protein [Syntrophobacter sp. SbD2]|nr:conserved hypothetical protein [Syntrophobacter sp. SbD2]